MYWGLGCMEGILYLYVMYGIELEVGKCFLSYSNDPTTYVKRKSRGCANVECACFTNPVSTMLKRSTHARTHIHTLTLELGVYNLFPLQNADKSEDNNM